MSTHVATLRIDPAHPALPGHFPGHPVVPGVVLLDEVQRAAQQWLGKPVALVALPQAKFLKPLLPQQEAQIQLALDGTELRFIIVRESCTIAQGLMRIRIGPDAVAESLP